MDLERQQINVVIIRCGRVLFPGVKDVKELLVRTAKAIGVEAVMMVSSGKAALPSAKETGPFFNCPACGGERLVVYGLCPTCEESEGGRYLSKTVCESCGYKARSGDHQLKVMREFGFEFETGSKKSLGLKTITDEGVK